MNWSIWIVIGALCLIGIVFMLEFVAIITICSFVATYMGLTGVLWWCVAVFFFIVINAVVGALMSIVWE